MTMRWLMTAGAMVLTSGAAAGQTRPGFTVGLGAHDYNYRERVENSTIVRHDGVLVALAASYVETIGSGWFLKAHAEGASGEVDYRNDEGARANDLEQQVSLLELGVGRDLPIGRAVLTPSIAVGVRTLIDDLGGRTASDGSVGYDREIYYAYVPVGLTLGVPVGRSQVSLSARYGFIFGGRSDSELSQADSRLPDLKLDIDGGHLWELNAALSVPLGQRALTFGPFVRRWSADASESRTVRVGPDEILFFEPAARTTEAGLRVSLSF